MIGRGIGFSLRENNFLKWILKYFPFFQHWLVPPTSRHCVPAIALPLMSSVRHLRKQGLEKSSCLRSVTLLPSTWTWNSNLDLSNPKVGSGVKSLIFFFPPETWKPLNVVTWRSHNQVVSSEVTLDNKEDWWKKQEQLRDNIHLRGEWEFKLKAVAETGVVGKDLRSFGD